MSAVMQAQRASGEPCDLSLPADMWAFEQSLDDGIHAALITRQLTGHLWSLANAGDDEAAVLRQACYAARATWVESMVRSWAHFTFSPSNIRDDQSIHNEVMALLQMEELP